MNVRVDCRRALLLGSLVMAGIAGDSGAAEPLRVRVSPAHSYEPAMIRIRIDVEPFADNRRLVVIADSGLFFRSTDISLDGARAPRIHEMAYDGLPSGEYVLAVDLYGLRGERASRRQAFVVIGRGR